MAVILKQVKGLTYDLYFIVMVWITSVIWFKHVLKSTGYEWQTEKMATLQKGHCNDCGDWKE